MLLETKLLIGCFVMLAAGLVFAVTKVLGAWAEHHITRHDLVVESRRRRLEYFKAVAERESADEDGQDVEFVDAQSSSDQDATYARAA